MLGVFGCVPAFDYYFRKGAGVSTFGPKSLRSIKKFYDDNAETLDGLKARTFDFVTGKETELLYPKAKLIDMVFFVEGYQ